MKFEKLQIGFYDPAERVREKIRQRQLDVQQVRQGGLLEVENLNRRLPGARIVPAWETLPPLE